MKISIYDNNNRWMSAKREEQAGVIGNTPDQIIGDRPINRNMFLHSLLQNGGETEFEEYTPWHLPRYMDSVMSDGRISDSAFIQFRALLGVFLIASIRSGFTHFMQVLWPQPPNRIQICPCFLHPLTQHCWEALCTEICR